MKEINEYDAALIAEQEEKFVRASKLDAIFEDVGLKTNADMYEVDTFIDDLFLQLNSDSFTRLCSIILDKKVNGEL